MRNDLLIETEQFDHGIVGKIYFDEDPLNPRKEWDQAATMVCWHRRYDLGDEQPSGDPTDYFRNMVDDDCPHCEGTGDEPGAEPEGDYNLVPDCAHCDGTGLISDEEAAVQLTGNLPRTGHVPLAGTMFKSAKVDVANPNSQTSTMNATDNTLRPGTPNQPKS